MLPGEAKFEIVTVMNKQWQDFDPDFHWPGSYIVWKLELSTPQQLAFDCEGISEDCAKTISEEGLSHGKKRKRNEGNWKAVQKKHKNVTGDGKKMKEPCPVTCRLKCSEKLDENTRKACFDEYWGTGSTERQWDFHLNNVLNFPIERRRRSDNAEGDSRRDMTKFYHLHDIRVCKIMYLNTLAISEQIVKTAFKKQVGASKVVCGDKRGGKRREMPEAREAIRRHISLFPTVDSHYCRKTTNTAYLSERLSVNKMHSLYLSWCIANNLKAQSYEYYLGVFNSDFKLSFFKRKKDKCLTCHAFENAEVSSTDKTLIFREEECLLKMSLAEVQNYDPSSVNIFLGNDVEKKPLSKESAKKQVQEKIRQFQEDPTLQAGQDSVNDVKDVKYEWRRHLYEKVLSRKLKKQFVENAHNFPAECTTAAFDLQQVLDCPFTNVGDAFYKRCLSCYNFVVHEKDHGQAHCFFWSQLDGKRGANEMSSCLFMFLREKSELGIKRCFFTCDSCPGQTRNRQMACALSYAVQTYNNLLSAKILFLLKRSYRK